MGKVEGDLYVRIYRNPSYLDISNHPYRVDLMDGDESISLRTATDYIEAWLMAKMMLFRERKKRRKTARVKKFKERIIR